MSIVFPNASYSRWESFVWCQKRISKRAFGLYREPRFGEDFERRCAVFLARIERAATERDFHFAMLDLQREIDLHDHDVCLEPSGLALHLKLLDLAQSDPVARAIFAFQWKVVPINRVLIGLLKDFVRRGAKKMEARFDRAEVVIQYIPDGLREPPVRIPPNLHTPFNAVCTFAAAAGWSRLDPFVDEPLAQDFELRWLDECTFEAALPKPL